MTPSPKTSDPQPSSLESRLQPERLPRHVAIIMDGNGRWAQAHGLGRVKGHEEGAESVRVVVRACRRVGVEALTLYAFSQENWGRPKAEVKALMTLLKRFLNNERRELKEKDIRLNAIGELARLPADVRRLLDKVMAETAAGRSMVLTLALSYGGRQELAAAARRLCQETAAGRLSPDQIDEDALAACLYTSNLPDPDLLIRTSGEQRLSNFLLWQAAYTEFYFTEVLWPDFREEQLFQALLSYGQRQRRYGLTSQQIGEQNVP